MQHHQIAGLEMRHRQRMCPINVWPPNSSKDAESIRLRRTVKATWHARKTAERNEILIRESLWIDTGDEFQGILVIDFLKDLVRELEAIDAPESVALAVVLKVFVASFQSAEIPFVFIHIVDVFAHQHTILIFDQKIMCRIGLAPQLSEHGGDVHVNVRQGVKEFAKTL